MWKGHHVSQGSGPIAWDHVCQPKAAGGIGEEWLNYQAPPQASWYWRKLVAIKNQVKAAMDIQQFALVHYKISNGYKALCPPQNKVNWSHENRNDILWNSRKQAHEQVVHVTKEDVKSRVVCNWPKNVKPIDVVWFSTL
uniref:Uncharacterized protein n=1 Tax=Cannabis sativa TaxID=3483 RepID=A0A803QH46_CANSA